MAITIVAAAVLAVAVAVQLSMSNAQTKACNYALNFNDEWRFHSEIRQINRRWASEPLTIDRAEILNRPDGGRLYRWGEWPNYLNIEIQGFECERAKVRIREIREIRKARPWLERYFGIIIVE